MLTREEAPAIYHAGPETVVKALCDLSRQVDWLKNRVSELQQEVRSLKEQIARL